MEKITFSDEQIEAQAHALLAQMSLEEKIGQMSGDLPLFPGVLDMLLAYNFRPFPAGENVRLGIPALQFTDGPRGVVIYHSTCFPVAMARGASWDVDLEARIGDAIGVEGRAQGANFFGGVCINVLRHPAWGRAQETYGEDPYHLGEMGAALVRGVQRHMMACIKHFALNSMENARFSVDVQVSERTLREVYLPHFKRCVDEGVAAVMSAYNQVNGCYCGHHRHLLRGILKDEWGFEGFVMSDFVLGVREAEAAALGGLDIEMPFRYHFGRRLQQLVAEDAVPAEVIDEAALRILRQKIRFAQIGEPERYQPQAVAGPAHRALAREAAVKSIVLLKNEPAKGDHQALLPLALSETHSIAVIGRLAAMANTGDHGSSKVRSAHVVTLMEGLRAAAGNQVRLVYASGRDIKKAAQAARQAQVAIVAAGYTYRDEGEFMLYTSGGDREALTLHPEDEALIRKIAAYNPRTVVVLFGGSAIVSEAWRESVPGILMAWYPGMEGGHALADLLFGKANPSGKLPIVFPKSAQQLPFFNKHARSIEYGYFHGYRWMDHCELEPAYPFGFGLSYTRYTYNNLRLEAEEIPPTGTLHAQVEVTNTGLLSGEEVIQFYIGYTQSKIERPRRELKGFTRLHLEPGESRTAALALPAEQLAYYDEAQAAWAFEPGEYELYAGSSSRQADLLKTTFHLSG